MASTLSFSRDELTAAFALLLPPKDAELLANEWFETIGAGSDADGRYVHSSTWGPPREVEAQSRVDVPAEWNAPDVVARDENLFLSWSYQDVRDWLLRLGETHLALLALVNDDLYERMRQVRFMTNKGAARNRLQVLRAVRAYRRAHGLPPAV
jgi:hypothetical protein